MSPFAFSQRSRGHNALAHLSGGMNLLLNITIHTVDKAGYGWSVVGVVELEGAGGFSVGPVVASCFAVNTFLGCEYEVQIDAPALQMPFAPTCR